MKFLYKIHSNYDGFTPSRIPDRLVQGKFLRLGWTKYLDEVERGTECWVYFHGRHAFTPGVYAKGFIAQIDRAQAYVLLRVREYKTNVPLTEAATSARIAEVVATRYRQVFLWPDEWDVIPQCHADSCQRRLCDNCATWRSMPRINLSDYREPTTPAEAVIPAYWIIPRRCYLFREQKSPAFSVRRASHMFGEFKVGEKRYTYPLARGMYEALRDSEQFDDFDAIIPIPLSPDKRAAGELHRTLALSSELSRLLAAPVRELLTLAEPVSKRRMLSAGYTLAEFRARYYAALLIDPSVVNYGHVLVVDDVITGGTTISCATRRLREANPGMEVVVASAGQMIVKHAVESEDGFVG